MQSLETNQARMHGFLHHEHIGYYAGLALLGVFELLARDPDQSRPDIGTRRRRLRITASRTGGSGVRWTLVRPCPAAERRGVGAEEVWQRILQITDTVSAHLGPRQSAPKTSPSSLARDNHRLQRRPVHLHSIPQCHQTGSHHPPA